MLHFRRDVHSIYSDLLCHHILMSMSFSRENMHERLCLRKHQSKRRAENMLSDIHSMMITNDVTADLRCRIIHFCSHYCETATSKCIEISSYFEAYSSRDRGIVCDTWTLVFRLRREKRERIVSVSMFFVSTSQNRLETSSE
jgi:GTP cyclohydrolase II